ncbi:nitrous oxide reductase family maturation protein NosD [Bacillus marasmi]|uniref:nitrous oxide reductase family maturation protein NosD n=1 Tax=Bacillus marasmi TaxID=1926279 RepID=UPI0011CC4A9A|nr:nitrous oxide reductase family maturation protein NosD [Bacillus marasmi]
MTKTLLLLMFSSILMIAMPQESTAAENLQAMIDSAEEGAVLQLDNRTYEGNIVIDKEIQIIGNKKTIIKGDGTGNVISVTAPNVTLRNLTVTNGSMNRNSAEEYAAIKLYSNGNTVDHIAVTDSFHGIYLSQSHHNTIENSNITGHGYGIIAKQGNGLHIYYSNDNLLKNNIVTGTRDGMYFDYANNNKIVGNKLSETRYGLHFMYSNENDFQGNTFTFNTGGAAIMESNGNKLNNNDFIFNYGHKSFGLFLLSAIDTEITNNTFILNQRGLYIDQSTNNLIKNNTIIRNQIGVELWASSNDQTFTLNNISENTIPVFALGGQGRNYWTKDNQGNNWGNEFPVLDLNQDGLGDQTVAYQSSLYELIEDQELTYLFLKSPAIGIYEKINQFFNQSKTMFEDSAPLVVHDESTGRWPWFLAAAIVILAVILLKGRYPLCIIFGRNGRKT